MSAPRLEEPEMNAPPSRLDFRHKAMLAVVCLGAGIAPFAARWIPDDVARVACGLLLVAAYLACTWFFRNHAALHQFWELAFAFSILAVVNVLNSALPGYVGTAVLHDPPTPGNPLASTVSGTLIIQLLESLIGVGSVVGLTKLSGRDLGSIYVRAGVIGRWIACAVLFFVVFYVFLATLPLRPESPARLFLPLSSLTLHRFLTLTPALLVVAMSNGFTEEVVVRGLFLPKFNAFFNPRLSNVLQAIIFSAAHAGITYSPSLLLFIVLYVFPLGLATGYLMRATKGILVPGIFHGTLDMAIYLGFLAAAS
jgi:membrane protease YdiL (CAAX protease family)